jgi:hypothetical protein
MMIQKTHWYYSSIANSKCDDSRQKQPRVRVVVVSPRLTHVDKRSDLHYQLSIISPAKKTRFIQRAVLRTMIISTSTSKPSASMRRERGGGGGVCSTPKERLEFSSNSARPRTKWQQGQDRTHTGFKLRMKCKHSKGKEKRKKRTYGKNDIHLSNQTKKRGYYL